jgi:hypothetical protein
MDCFDCRWISFFSLLAQLAFACLVIHLIAVIGKHQFEIGDEIKSDFCTEIQLNLVA